MEIKNTDLISLFEKELRNITQENLEEIGTVLQVGDGACIVHGLEQAILGELVEFEGGNKGIVFQLDENSVSIFLLYNNIPVAELEVVKRTGGDFKVPVGMKLLGRIIDATGMPIDELGQLEFDEVRPIESVIPGVVDRVPVNQSLETGIMAIDALVPIGKGQRELIIGNQGTGKTAIAIDTIVNQKGKNVLVVFVAIGQRKANIVRTINFLSQQGALEYTVIVTAELGESVLNQYVAPYVGCTIAEYFRDKGHDVLIVYDDLSNHAIAFREMSLLLRRPPGREAYPGDIFYLHSRLLERAGKFTQGGSITALPIVQIQGDDITGYIPTNLISITDGQIFLDTQLFNQGIRPAVNAELSVSRVGGAAQRKAMQKMTKALRLELAQYQELLDFAQFGTELDDISRRKLARGALAVELLKQEQYYLYSFVDQVLMLLLLRENFLDELAIDQVRSFVVQYASYVKSVYPQLYGSIAETGQLSDDSKDKAIAAGLEFKKIFVPAQQEV